MSKKIWNIVHKREKMIEKFKSKNEKKIQESVVLPKIEQKMEKIAEPGFCWNYVIFGGFDYRFGIESKS